jgi:hypothetical protein
MWTISNETINGNKMKIWHKILRWIPIIGVILEVRNHKVAPFLCSHKSPLIYFGSALYHGTMIIVVIFLIICGLK